MMRFEKWRKMPGQLQGGGVGAEESSRRARASRANEAGTRGRALCSGGRVTRSSGSWELLRAGSVHPRGPRARAVDGGLRRDPERPQKSVDAGVGRRETSSH